MHRRTFAAHIALAIFFLTTRADAVRVIPLGDLPGGQAYSEPTGISADGKTVVGWSHSDIGQQAFIWTEATGMRRLIENPPRGIQGGSLAYDISGDGKVVIGYGANVFNSIPKPFGYYRWSEATGAIDLNPLNYHDHDLNAVSANGRVVAGRRHHSNGTLEAILWYDDGRELLLGGLPGWQSNNQFNPNPRSNARLISDDGSVVVGGAWSQNYVGGEIFRWTAETGMVPIGQASVTAMSGDGNIILGSVNSVWSKWTTQTGWVPSTKDGQPFGIFDLSSDGQSLLGEKPNVFTVREFAYFRDGQWHDVDEVLQSSGYDLDQWRLISLSGISDDGNFLYGRGFVPEGYSTGWVIDLRPIPEPKGLFVTLFSACIVVFWKRLPTRDRV